MTPQPIIEECTYHVESRVSGHSVMDETRDTCKCYVVACRIVWDAQTDIVVSVREPANEFPQQSKETRMRLMGNRCARIAEIVANAGNMVNELTELKPTAAQRQE